MITHEPLMELRSEPLKRSEGVQAGFEFAEDAVVISRASRASQHIVRLAVAAHTSVVAMFSYRLALALSMCFVQLTRPQIT